MNTAKRKAGIIFIIFSVVVLSFVYVLQNTNKNEIKDNMNLSETHLIETTATNELVSIKKNNINDNYSEYSSISKKIEPIIINATEKESISDSEISNNEFNYRYSDDNVFYYELFSGLLNDSNIDSRNDLFSRKDYELAIKQMENINSNPIDDIVEQFENVIDYSLGIDFPNNKRLKMRNIQREMLSTRQELTSLLSEDTISKELYLTRVTALVNNSMQKIAEILSDEEFIALYQIKKEEINNVSSTLVNLSEENYSKNSDNY